jgi:hypothetical protein
MAAGLGIQASAYPGKSWFSPLELPEWPSLSLELLPPRLQHILQLTPRSLIDAKGRLVLHDTQHRPLGYAPLIPTQWNRENSHPWDRLSSNVRWGLVLHWFGNVESDSFRVQNYLYGFDDLREVQDYTTRTSAHFLVGGGRAVIEDSPQYDPIGILQMQAADLDGTPYVASHLQAPDYQLHHDKGQYFVRALYTLGFEDPTVHSILQDIFDGRHMDSNMRTIGIEITGQDFEHGATQPSDQKVANVLSVVWAVMQRYGIRASDIFGHHEYSLSKADPGKKFTSLMRLLVGAKALVEQDVAMKELVFGQHLSADRQPWQAIQAYFRFVHDFLVLVDRPLAVYEWEFDTGYWFVHDLTDSVSLAARSAAGFRRPFLDALPSPVTAFTIPQHHEGVDLMHDGRLPDSSVEVRLTGLGECLYTGESLGYHPGQLAIFRHRMPDGVRVLSVYGHLDRLANLQAGRLYPPGELIGTSRLTRSKDHLLHFAVGYGATWESDLRSNPNIPLNVGSSWILQRYLQPVEYLSRHLEPSERRGWTRE